MKWKQLLLIIFVSAGSAVASVWGYNKFTHKDNPIELSQAKGNLPVNYAGFYDKNETGEPADFTKAASASVQAVVHIKTKIPAKRVSIFLEDSQLLESYSETRASLTTPPPGPPTDSEFIIMLAKLCALRNRNLGIILLAGKRNLGSGA